MTGTKPGFASQWIATNIKLVASILSLVALIILPVVLVTLILPILIVRRIISHLASIFHPEFTKILSQRSTNFCLDEFHTHTENAILVDYVLQGNYPIDLCKTSFAQRVLNQQLPNGGLKYPELKQFVVSWMNFKFWKNQDDFDINDHIKLYNQKSRPEGLSAEEVVTQKEFHAFRQSLLNEAFPRNKSPWEIIVIHNYCPDDPIVNGRRKDKDKPLSVIILKFHHSLGDGYSLTKMSMDWFGTNSQVNTNGDSKHNHSKAATIDSVNLKQLWETLMRSLTFFITCVYEFVYVNVQLRVENSSWNVPEDKQAPAVHTFTNCISVSRIKRIKNHLKMSFSSILFHVCNEAMQKMMTKKGKFSKDVVVIFPLPLPDHPNDKLANHMTHGAITLPARQERIPSKKRLEVVYENYESIKQSTLPFSIAWLTLTVGGMFTSLQKHVARGLVPSVVISNFSVPYENLDWSLDGHKAVSSYFNVGLLNMSGVAFSLMTIWDDLKLGVTANSNHLNEIEIQEFASIMEMEFTCLEKQIH